MEQQMTRRRHGTGDHDTRPIHRPMPESAEVCFRGVFNQLRIGSVPEVEAGGMTQFLFSSFFFVSMAGGAGEPAIMVAAIYTLCVSRDAWSQFRTQGPNR